MTKIKKMKHEASSMLKYIRHVKFRYNPFMAKNTGTREVARVLTGPKGIKSNPFATYEVDIMREYKPPSVDVTWWNKSKTTLATQGYKYQEILVLLEFQASECKFDLENQGIMLEHYDDHGVPIKH